MPIFEYVKYVTTPLSLIAFLAVLLYYYHWRRNKKDIDLIKTVPESERASLIVTLSEKFQIDTSQLNKKDLYKTVINVIEHKTRRLKIKGIIFLLATIILGAMIIFWQTLSKNPLTTTIKVSVQGIIGNKSVNLKDGILNLESINVGPRKSPINENGEAFFQNLLIGQKIRLSFTCSEPYKTIYPDSMFEITNNATFFLPVALQNIDHIAGIVLYGDSPLSGVMVQWDTSSVFTDRMGKFRIKVPLDLQSDQYVVRFTKDGFKFKTRMARPSSGDMEILMEPKKD